MVQAGEQWQFIARNQQAEQVYLVRECIPGESVWLAMSPAESGQWQLALDLDAGHYRFRHVAVEGRTVVNCGCTALNAFRIAGEDPGVYVEPNRADRTAWSA
jgi:hypothetical protein